MPWIVIDVFRQLAVLLLSILSLFVTFQVSIFPSRTIFAWSIAIGIIKCSSYWVFFNASKFLFTAIGFGFHYWLVVIATRNEICKSQKTIIVESTDVAVVPALNDYQDLITAVVSPS